jgi:phosphatidylserine synthase
MVPVDVLSIRSVDLVGQAAWILVAAFVLSLAYELYRATVKAGTSPHDSMAAFVRTDLALYVVAAVVIASLFAGFRWAPWVGLIFSAAVTAVSILYYNPKIMPARKPGLLDWFEDLVFTGLNILATALLLYQVLGVTLEP